MPGSSSWMLYAPQRVKGLDDDDDDDDEALHFSGGTSTHHQEHTQIYLRHLVLVKPLLLPVALRFEKYQIL